MNKKPSSFIKNIIISKTTYAPPWEPEKNTPTTATVLLVDNFGNIEKIWVRPAKVHDYEPFLLRTMKRHGIHDFEDVYSNKIIWLRHRVASPYGLHKPGFVERSQHMELELLSKVKTRGPRGEPLTYHHPYGPPYLFPPPVFPDYYSE